MQMDKKYLVGIGAVALLVLGGLSATGKLKVPGFVGSQSNSATTTPEAPYTIEEVSFEEFARVSAPDYRRKINFAPSLSNEIKLNIANRAAVLANAIEKDRFDASSWLELGLSYYMAGDYEGARIMWQYVASIAPTDPVAFANLGNLYHQNLKDYPKAEENYLRAIKNKSDYVSAYRSLYELYRYSYAAKAGQAPVILLQGIEKNPSAYDLIVLLAMYYKEKGDTFHALEYYKKAKGVAETAGNTALAAVLQAEIDALE